MGAFVTVDLVTLTIFIGFGSLAFGKTWQIMRYTLGTAAAVGVILFFGRRVF
jgi:hypothetical protein